VELSRDEVVGLKREILFLHNQKESKEIKLILKDLNNLAVNNHSNFYFDESFENLLKDLILNFLIQKFLRKTREIFFNIIHSRISLQK